MRIIPVFAVIGEVLRFFAFAFLPPTILAIFDQNWDSVLSFGVSFLVTLGVGQLAHMGFERLRTPIYHRVEALAIVAFTWLVIGLFGGIPYLFAGLDFADAFFETISGFTTTGATILTDFSLYDRSFYLWRAMTQWFGGLGVIALFVVVLPRLGIAGRQLFFAEASGASDEPLMPQVRHTASRLWLLYSGLTVLQIILLVVVGFAPYDAICHAFTTIAAGGFSPNGQSIMGYDNPAAEWVIIPFMLISGTSFTLLYKVLSRNFFELFRDGEFAWYFSLMLILGVTTAFLIDGNQFNAETLRQGLFQVASVMSSTGYASEDYNVWNDAARVTLVVAMLIGGCAGSAAGGAKVIRYVLFGKHIKREITRIIHPQAIIPIKYKGRVIPNHVIHSVVMLVAMYILGYFLLGVFTVVVGGTDLVTGFSAALACLGNIGPGFGPAGPMGNFASFNDATKVALTLGMWVGRLEIVTVLALLHSHVWRHLTLMSHRCEPNEVIRSTNRPQK
jgi:trk system potassium uptake protein TrkH